jgi:hypothetical protein
MGSRLGMGLVSNFYPTMSLADYRNLAMLSQYLPTSLVWFVG